jgi:hypothetical protein
MQITRNSLATNTGPSDWFTGTVYGDAVATPAQPSRLGASLVRFTLGARTAWHTHPYDQTIYVTEASASAGTRARRSRRSVSATACTSSPVRTSGTGRRPTGAWPWWPCRKPMTAAAPL